MSWRNRAPAAGASASPADRQVQATPNAVHASKPKGRCSMSDPVPGPMHRFDASQGPRVVGPQDGKAVDLGTCAARFMIWGEESGGGFALVEHPIPPRHLAAPLHRHTREDEYSYVVEGRLGAQLGSDVVYAEAGELVFK